MAIHGLRLGDYTSDRDEGKEVMNRCEPYFVLERTKKYLTFEADCLSLNEQDACMWVERPIREAHHTYFRSDMGYRALHLRVWIEAYVLDASARICSRRYFSHGRCIR